MDQKECYGRYKLIFFLDMSHSASTLSHRPPASLVIQDAVTYTEHAKRKTATAMDVVYAKCISTCISNLPFLH